MSHEKKCPECGSKKIIHDEQRGEDICADCGLVVERELVDLGRVMLAIEKYKRSEASIERAARIAGVSISKMMDILHEHNVEMNLQREDYLKGLDSLRKTW